MTITMALLEKAIDRIRQLDVERWNSLQRLHEAIAEYRTQRLELLQAMLEEKSLSWCTLCWNVFSTDILMYIYTEGKTYMSSRHHESGYWYEQQEILHRACPSCYEATLDRHGWRGTYDSQAGVTPYFNAFKVEKRADGLYVRKFGEWRTLDKTNESLLKPSTFRLDELMREWELPPEVRLDWGWGRRLIINNKEVEEVSI